MEQHCTSSLFKSSPFQTDAERRKQCAEMGVNTVGLLGLERDFDKSLQMEGDAVRRLSHLA